MSNKKQIKTLEDAMCILKYLQDTAKTVANYEDSIFEDERGMASSEARELVEVLLNLDLNSEAKTEAKKTAFYVTHKIEARYIAAVEADNVEDALKKAQDELSNADFGEAEDIDGEAVNVEDADGNRVWER